MNARELKQRLTLYEKLMRLDKPIGTLLLLVAHLLGACGWRRRASRTSCWCGFSRWARC
jgi:4-hydroxybenzoate polyprenyltransferase